MPMPEKDRVMLATPFSHESGDVEHDSLTDPYTIITAITKAGRERLAGYYY